MDKQETIDYIKNSSDYKDLIIGKQEIFFLDVGKNTFWVIAFQNNKYYCYRLQFGGDALYQALGKDFISSYVSVSSSVGIAISSIIVFTERENNPIDDENSFKNKFYKWFTLLMIYGLIVFLAIWLMLSS